MGFHDESGISEKPVVAETWALKGQTPTIISQGSWKRLSLSGTVFSTPDGQRPKLFLRVFHGAVKDEHIIRYVKELKRHLRGKKLLLIWDGLPAHRSKKVKDYIKTQKNWFRAKRLPAYAPELNPVDYLWSAMKRKDLANLPPKGLSDLKQKVYRSKRRIAANSDLLKGFLKAGGFY